MAYVPEVKILPALQILNADTEAGWLADDIVLPPNMMAYASDTKTLKIGDGVLKYSELAVFYSAGLVDAKKMVTFVGDIADRDVLPPNKKTGIVVVLDASGDPTVESGTKKQATYVWDGDTEQWMKLAEEESMDVDLSPYFHMVNNTADDIKDGTTKVMMTAEERTTLADAVCYSHSIVLQGVNSAGLKEMLEVTP